MAESYRDMRNRRSIKPRHYSPGRVSRAEKNWELTHGDPALDPDDIHTFTDSEEEDDGSRTPEHYVKLNQEREWAWNPARMHPEQRPFIWLKVDTTAAAEDQQPDAKVVSIPALTKDDGDKAYTEGPKGKDVEGEAAKATDESDVMPVEERCPLKAKELRERTIERRRAYSDHPADMPRSARIPIPPKSTSTNSLPGYIRRFD